MMNMWCAQTKKPKTAMATEKRDRGVAEDALAAEGGDHLGDDAHAGQDHDVDGGVRVEPEQVLEEKRVAALGGIEDADAEVRSSPTSTRVMANTGVPSTMRMLAA
jgi:hypothetical protein